MKKKISLIILALFSFYYTNRVTEYIKQKDPIMKEIINRKEEYKQDYKNAQIIGNNILSGKKGKEIDLEESYQKMKRYGTFNESLITLKETIPVISTNNIYNKYLVGGIKEKKEIALIFPIKEDQNPQRILSILKEKNSKGTIFIDGTYLENHIKEIKNHREIEWEILSYQGEYQKEFLKTSLSYLESITQKKPKYCYSYKEEKKILSLCEKLNLHTVKPTVFIQNNLFSEIKEKLDNAIMIAIEDNTNTRNQLPIVLDYIKEKGYQLVSLEELLKE